MMQLTITKGKPNPIGKDRGWGDIPSSQLAAEWMQFENTGNEPFPLENVVVQHTIYPPSNQWAKVSGFSGILPVGHSVRVHSGAGPENVLREIDREGAHYHIFTGENYVWNNTGDKARLYIPVQLLVVDIVSYNYAPEGRILVRNNGSLV